jgi:RNA polymerase sigma-70 factor (ECF subfamily)
MTLSDEALVRNYREGRDPEGAFLELYERHRTETYAFFRRRIGSPDIAAEQNQDLYLAAVEHLREFRGECSFRTWLFQIAHFQLSNLRRRWRVHVDERANDVPEELLTTIQDPDAPDPENQAGRAEIVRALRRCIWALPEIERSVIFGQYYEGVTLNAITGRLGLSNPSGARASLIAAQRKLRICLETAGVLAPRGASGRSPDE